MVTVYSKNNCVQCKMTKRFLDSNNIAYQEINLDEQPEFIEQVKELGFSAAPIIQTPTEVFSGFQPAKLKKTCLTIRTQSFYVNLRSLSFVMN